MHYISKFIVLAVAILGTLPCTHSSSQEKVDALGDPIPFGAITRLGSPRLSHYAMGMPTDFELAHRSRCYITLSKTARIWDSETGALRHEIEFEGAAPRKLEVFEDSNEAAFLLVSFDATSKTQQFRVQFVDLESGEKKQSWDWNPGLKLPYIQSWHFTSDRARVVLLCQGGVVFRIAQAEPNRFAKLDIDMQVSSSIYDANQDTIYVTESHSSQETQESTIWKLDLRSMKPKVELARKVLAKIELLMVADQPSYAMIGEGKSISIQPLQMGGQAQAASLPIPIRDVRMIDGSGGASNVVIRYINVDGEWTLLKLDLQKGTSTPLPEFASSNGLLRVDSKTGRMIYYDNFSGRYVVTDWESGEQLLPPPQADVKSIEAIAFAHDEKSVFTLTSKAIRQRQLPSGELLREIPMEGILMSFAISANGRWIAASVRDTTVYLWDLEAKRIAHTLALKAPITGPRVALTFTPDSRELLTYSNDNLLRRWDVETGELKSSIRFEAKLAGGRSDGMPSFAKGEPRAYRYPVFSFDARYLSAQAQSDIDLINTSTGEIEWINHFENKRFAKLVHFPLSGEEARFAMIAERKKEDGTEQYGIELAGPEVDEGAQFFELPTSSVLEYMYAALAVDTESKYLAVDLKIEDRSEFRLWSLESNKLIHSIEKSEGHRFGMMTFSPSGKYFAARTVENDVLVWVMETFEK